MAERKTTRTTRKLRDSADAQDKEDASTAGPDGVVFAARPDETCESGDQDAGSEAQLGPSVVEHAAVATSLTRPNIPRQKLAAVHAYPAMSIPLATRRCRGEVAGPPNEQDDPDEIDEVKGIQSSGMNTTSLSERR